MKTEVLSAVIALIGVILSVSINVLINMVQTKYNYNQLFAQTVSSSRERWLCILRENLSKCLACAEVLNNLCCEAKDNGDKESDCKRLEYEKEFLESRGMVVSRLNMNEDLHRLMFSAINQLDYTKPCTEFVAKREYVYELSRQLLKEEWKRVKDEARGKKK